jgi:hypothetical protein
MGGQPCLQRTAAGTKAKEMGLEHLLGGGKAAGGGCDRTTSRMKGLSTKIISEDSR